MPKGGLEPPRVTSHAPQTCASASSATSAKGVIYKEAAGIIAAINSKITTVRSSYPQTGPLNLDDYRHLLFGDDEAFGLSPLFAAGEVLLAGELVGDNGLVAPEFDRGAGVGVAAGALSGTDCKTDLCPVNIGSDNVKAISMNAAAAPMVIFARRLAVPRGPKAVLDKLLEKSAPASALPGCKRMTTIRMTQARINNP